MVDSATSRIIQYGADIAGASAGAALEFLGKSPPGSGAILAAVLASTLKEFGARSLSPREKTRVGAVASYFADRIWARLVSGDVPRSDGFFVPTGNDRPPSEALLEGVLLQARDEFDEKKLRHLGSFFANLVFVEDVSPATAYLLLNRLDRLSYRQLALLSLIGAKGPYDMEPLRRPDHTDAELDALKREEMDLQSNDLGTLGLLRGQGSWADVLSPLGKALFELATLDEIPVDVTAALEAVITKLRSQQSLRENKR
jgi:hypothetical protein